MTTIKQLYQLALSRNASDIYLTSGLRPLLRVKGSLLQLDELPPFSQMEMATLLTELFRTDQLDALNAGREIIQVFELEDGGRIRVLPLMGYQGYTLACRLLPVAIPSMEALRLPEALRRVVADSSSGLVMIIGSPASGKSTTLASLIDYLNQHFEKRILTVENPVEFVHHKKSSLVTQLQVKDVIAAEHMLQPGILQGVDVLALDGLDARSVVGFGLEAAANGALVIGTMASVGDTTTTLYSSMRHLSDENRDFWKKVLGRFLRAVIWQRLLPLRENTGRRLVAEVLINDRVIGDLLSHPGYMHLLRPAMAAGRVKGMRTMRQALQDVKLEGDVDPLEIASMERALVDHYSIPVTDSF